MLNNKVFTTVLLICSRMYQNGSVVKKNKKALLLLSSTLYLFPSTLYDPVWQTGMRKYYRIQPYLWTHWADEMQNSRKKTAATVGLFIQKYTDFQFTIYVMWHDYITSHSLIFKILAQIMPNMFSCSRQICAYLFPHFQNVNAKYIQIDVMS